MQKTAFFLIFIAFLAGCGTPSEIPTTIATKPAGVTVLARNTDVTTKQGGARAAAIEIHDLYSRGERTRLLVETVARPAAVLILFAGGKGALHIAPDGKIGWGNGNFLIRSRPLFLKRGFNTAVFDAPTDHANDLRFGFRGSAEHAADIGVAIRHLRDRYKAPIWLVGTSRGTNSVANAAARLGRIRPDGIVLTSSMMADNDKGDSLFDYPLENITVPTLVLHHAEDDCFVTPASEVPRLKGQLKNAKPLRVMMQTGGTVEGRACGAWSHHGFRRIEDKVVGDIARWIRAPAGAARP
ncbi:MAG: alpha/beta hydrolase [Alphaproteobacteria bacterium]|nr:alpha/beta hydrolase [Alphaproteobacteria bacterium]